MTNFTLPPVPPVGIITRPRQIPRGFGEVVRGPPGIAQEHRQAGVMRLQGFPQVRGVVRVEDRDGAHVRSCQKVAQS